MRLASTKRDFPDNDAVESARLVTCGATLLVIQPGALL